MFEILIRQISSSCERSCSAQIYFLLVDYSPKGTVRCLRYDPRFRPWYSSIATGPKDVVLVLDKSGSMQGSRMRLAHEAALKVIDTFGENDFVGVVLFNNNVCSWLLQELQGAVVI